ncbi:MFS transporter [Streptomyces sp. FR-108]|uniref:MFS transporter n=1 Tax=Streptomyces sp. FR-108 TaxID=3416665 RepID=UPI003CF119FB
MRNSAAVHAAPRHAAETSGTGKRGFWIVTSVLALTLTAASAPTPLYGIYAADWHFSSITLTVVFAIYAVALLFALLAFGTLSDAIGRKPVIIAALVLQAAGMLWFITADSVTWLVVARIAQGLATGLVSAAVSAALLDLQPPGRTGLAALTNALMSTAGLGAGALGSGALVEYAPHPQRLVYIVVLIAAVVLLVAVIFCVDETVTAKRRPQLWSSIAVPKALVPAFLAAAPCLVATLALGGLYLSLGPSLAHELNHSTNHLLGGAVPAMLCGTGALATAVMRSSSARSCIIVGCTTLAVGPGLTAVALGIGNSPLFYASTVIAGVGFGVGYLGTLRSLVTLADPEHRGALVSAIYLVAYTAFSVPVVVAGVVTTREGLEHTAIGFCAVLAVLAVTALAATLRTSNRAARVAPPSPAGLTDSQSS